MNDTLYLRYRALLAQVLRVYVLSRIELFAEYVGDARSKLQELDELYMQVAYGSVDNAAPEILGHLGVDADTIARLTSACSSTADYAQATIACVEMLNASIINYSIDYRSDFISLISSVDLEAAVAVDEAENLAISLEQLLTRVAGSTDITEILSHGAAEALSYLAGRVQGDLDSSLRLTTELISVANGNEQSVCDVRVDLPIILEKLANYRMARANSARVMSDEHIRVVGGATDEEVLELSMKMFELIATASAYSYIIVHGRAFMDVKSICIALFNSAIAVVRYAGTSAEFVEKACAYSQLAYYNTMIQVSSIDIDAGMSLDEVIHMAQNFINSLCEAAGRHIGAHSTAANLITDLLGAVYGSGQLTESSVADVQVAMNNIVSTVRANAQSALSNACIIVSALANGSAPTADTACVASYVEGVDVGAATAENSRVLEVRAFELLTVANVYSYAQLLGQAIGVISNVCGAFVNDAIVSKTSGRDVLQLFRSARPAVQGISVVLMRHVARASTLANALGHYITDNSMYAGVKALSTVNFVIQEPAELLNVCFNSSLGTLLAMLHRPMNVCIQLGYSMSNALSAVLQQADGFVIMFGYTMYNAVSPTLHEPVRFAHNSLIASSFIAGIYATSDVSIVMHIPAKPFCDAAGYEIEVPSKRGNVLRLPTVYSATQIGKVLVVT